LHPLTTQEIGDIYDRHFDKIYRFFYYRTLSREQAEDLTSETFTQFVRELKRKPAIQNPEHYLYGIAQFTFQAFLRSKYRQIKQVPLEVADFIKSVQTTLETYDDSAADLESIAIGYLDKLPDKQAQVLKLRIIEKLTPTEVAHRLSKNLNYVKTTQKRALKSIKQLIALYPPETLIN